MKILFLAFSCEPNRTSEPGVGWNISNEIAKRHDVTVITRLENKKVIEEYYQAHPERRENSIGFYYYDLQPFVCWIEKNLPYGLQIYHEIWHFIVANKFKKIFNDYDIVHRLTMAPAYSIPWGASYSDRFVWGPVGGCCKTGMLKRSFIKNEGIVSKIGETLYNAVAWLSMHPLLFVERKRKSVNAVLFRFSSLQKCIKLAHSQCAEVVSETAYPNEVKERKYTEGQHPLKVIYVGRIIPLKAPRYAIDGMVKFIENEGMGELHIYGDGAMRPALEKHVSKLKCNDKIHFHGNVSHEKILEVMKKADILLHPSFREGASWSILEAMVNGMPVICQNNAGMRDMVSEDCGIKMEAENPKELVDGIANSLLEYYRHPEKIKQHGLAGQLRVKAVYNLDNISRKIEKVYLALMGK